MLQEADPENKADVCVSNYPVSYVDLQPYYYDGRQQFIEKDDKGNYVRGGYPTGTFKLKIFYDTLEDALLDNPDMELDLSGITYEGKVSERHMEAINEWIAEGRKFVAWLKAAKEAHDKGLLLPPIIDSEIGDLSNGKPKQTWLRKLYNWFMSLEPDWLKNNK